VAKKKQKKIVTGVQEFEGFQVGDTVWYELVDGRIGKGKIQSFSTKDQAGPTLCVWDEINHGYRSGLVSNASFDAPPSGHKVLNRAVARRARAESVNKKK
jgi:hypothetical protein